MRSEMDDRIELYAAGYAYARELMIPVVKEIAGDRDVNFAHGVANGVADAVSEAMGLDGDKGVGVRAAFVRANAAAMTMTPAEVDAAVQRFHASEGDGA